MLYYVAEDKMDINLMAPANPLGYGVVGVNILKTLVSEGHSVSYFPIGQISIDQSDTQIFQSCVDNQASFNANAPSLRIWHQHDLAQHVGRGVTCGFPIFELDKFTEREIHHISSQDILFVCSHWAKGLVSQYNHNVHIAPLGVDTSIFSPSKQPAEETTRFINIGKWEIRKGHDVLVEAFNQAFTDEDDVELLMMNHNPFISSEQEQEWMRLYKNSKLGDKIFFLERVEKHEQVADIMKRVDCGVFLSRAEGWNLEALELMACGKQVIITSCSAHSEFCNFKNSLLVKPESQEEAYDGIWFHGQGNWAAIKEAEIRQCADHMRKVYEDKRSGNDTFNKHGVETANKFSWENTVQKIVGAFS